jgi:hypothetical protein
MVTRRDFLVGMACACWVSPSFAQTQRLPTCVRYQTAPADASGGLSGLAKLDLNVDYGNGLIAILADLGDQLGIRPSFALYDDPATNPNALSCQTPLLTEVLGSSKDGTVAVGRRMIELLRIKSADFGSALTATCAHEYGHILQFRTVYDKLQRLPQGDIKIELHADFVCGYYGAHRKRIDPLYDALTQAVTQFEAGDKKESNQIKYVAVSHGTYEQRGDAVYAGYLLGLGGRLSPELVAERGFEYVRGLSF